MPVLSPTAQTKNLLAVLWSGMLIAIGIYALACVLLVEAPDDAAGNGESLRYLFTAAALGFGGLSIWWHRRFLAPHGPPTLAVGELRSHSLVVWALSEAVAICGLLLGVLTHAVNEFVPFALAAAALLLLHRPSSLPFERLREPMV